MTQSKEPQNEKLINDLYEKLNWYTFEASNEQFDAKEVDAIVQLLDVLEPMKEDPVYPSDPAAARERFYKRYGLEAERAEQNGSAEKTGITAEDGTDRETAEGKPKKRKKKKMFVRFAAGLVACLVLMLSVNVGSYALKKKSFFEVVRDGIGRTKVTVTGNIDNIDDEILATFEYQSWEEVEKAVGESILEPVYMPKEYALDSIEVKLLEYEKKIVATYVANNANVRIKINIYEDRYINNIIQYDEEWVLLKEEKVGKKAQYYLKGNKIEAFFTKGNAVYFIYSTLDLEQVEKIVKEMN